MTIHGHTPPFVEIGSPDPDNLTPEQKIEQVKGRTLNRAPEQRDSYWTGGYVRPDDYAPASPRLSVTFHLRDKELSDFVPHGDRDILVAWLEDKTREIWAVFDNDPSTTQRVI